MAHGPGRARKACPLCAAVRAVLCPRFAVCLLVVLLLVLSTFARRVLSSVERQANVVLVAPAALRLQLLSKLALNIYYLRTTSHQPPDHHLPLQYMKKASTREGAPATATHPRRYTATHHHRVTAGQCTAAAPLSLVPQAEPMAASPPGSTCPAQLYTSPCFHYALVSSRRAAGAAEHVGSGSGGSNPYTHGKNLSPGFRGEQHCEKSGALSEPSMVQKGVRL